MIRHRRPHRWCATWDESSIRPAQFLRRSCAVWTASALSVSSETSQSSSHLSSMTAQWTMGCSSSGPIRRADPTRALVRVSAAVEWLLPWSSGSVPIRRGRGTLSWWLWRRLLTSRRRTQAPCYGAARHGQNRRSLVRYGEGMTEGLPADVADVLALVLHADDPVHVALRRQVPYLNVRARCTCGCGTAYFELDTSEVEPASTGPSTAVAAEAQLVSSPIGSGSRTVSGMRSTAMTCHGSNRGCATTCVTTRHLGSPHDRV